MEAQSEKPQKDVITFERQSSGEEQLPSTAKHNYSINDCILIGLEDPGTNWLRLHLHLICISNLRLLPWETLRIEMGAGVRPWVL